MTQLRSVKRLIALASVAILLAASAVSAPVFLDAIDRRERGEDTRAEMLPIQTQYEDLTAQFPETPIPVEAMELAVLNYDKIDDLSFLPTDLLSQISDVIAAHSTIRLSGFVWRLTSTDELTTTEALLLGETTLDIELYGEQIGSSSFRSSDDLLRQFMAALEEIEGAVVSPIQLPIETGPDAEVNTRINDEVLDAAFSLNIRIES